MITKKIYNGHLHATVHWLITTIPIFLEHENVKFDLPAGVSKRDFHLNLVYINGLYKGKGGGASLLSCLDWSNNNIIYNLSEQDTRRLKDILQEASKILSAQGYDQFEYNKKEGGFINKDNPGQRVVFKEGSTARLVLDELYSALDRIITTKIIADNILNKHGKEYSLDSIRSTKNNTIVKKFNDAVSIKGYKFPYEVRHFDSASNPHGYRSVNIGKNSGYGLFHK